ncbi:MAG: serine/threonine protein kinase [Planctomycetaceae bacterium]|jgi:serine/threonine protein kinase|nr:serine/threonine protein kinase [Planctomycetaceae bacterium]
MSKSNSLPAIIPANNMLSGHEDRNAGSGVYNVVSSSSSNANVTIDYGSSETASKNDGDVKEEGSYKPGTILGGSFRLERLLGRGGMGEAWKAFDQVANRQVVVKFVPKEVQNVKRAVEMVRDSFQRIHSLQHQHICPVYSLSHDAEHGLFVVMKYVNGVTLDEYRKRQIAKYGGVLTNELMDILWSIAKTLDYAHSKRVIHRDIKPQNIMVSREDGIQIIDFGLAEEIRASMVEVSETVVMGVVGTRPYMAPEQWRGRFQDARTDQYAFAATAYEMLSGAPPFHSNDVAILRECVLRDRPKRIVGIPDYMNEAILKGLAKKRSERFETCKDLVKAMIKRPHQKKGSSTFPGVLAADPENPPQGQIIKQANSSAIGTNYTNTWRPETMMATNYSINEQPPMTSMHNPPNQQQPQPQPQTFQLPQNVPLWIVVAVCAVLMIMFMLLVSLVLFTYIVMRSEHKPTHKLPDNNTAVNYSSNQFTNPNSNNNAGANLYSNQPHYVPNQPTYVPNPNPNTPNPNNPNPAYSPSGGGYISPNPYYPPQPPPAVTSPPIVNPPK